MQGGNVIFNFTAETKDLEKKTLQISDIVKGSLISKAITKGISVVNDSLDGAIKRVDTLNNFPNVMGNLGIGAEESTKVINELSDELTGLPTTLDSAVSAVQRFTSKNGDVSKSAKMFLAVNNAILAGGASMDIQSSALEQLSQAYSKGKPDMMEWRTLQMAMPAQLNQVARAFNMTADDMGEALRDGSLSMDDFINKIMELNTKGVGEFASFEQQARSSTGGIATSLTNFKTAITRGVANTINAINTSLAENDLPTFPEIIQSITKEVNKIFKGVVQGVNTIIPIVAKIVGWIKENKELISTLTVIIIGFIATFKTIKTVVAIINAVKTAMALLNAVMLANPIALIVAAIVGLVAGFIYLWNTSESFRNFWIGLWEGIKNAAITVWQAITGFFTETIPNFIKDVIEWFKELPGKMLDIGKNIVEGLWNGIKNAKDWLVKKVKGFAKGIIGGIKDALGIHSPSTLTYDMGVNLDKGMLNGINSMDKELQSSYDGIFDFEDMFNLSPSLYGSTSNNLSPTVNVINNVNVEQDPLGQMVNRIKTFSGGSKNDYNYGGVGG